MLSLNAMAPTGRLTVGRGRGPTPTSRTLPLMRARSGRAVEEPFNEGAAQVRRLVQRDRKEMLGNAGDILDKYTTEFGDGASAAAAVADDDNAALAAAAAAFAPTSTSSSSSSTTPTPSSSSSSPFAAAAAAPSSPFGGSAAAAASPFGSAAAAAPRPSRLASIEPRGLSPDMGPDPLTPPPRDTRSWLARITLTQVVLFLSFSTIIGIMIGTFFVVVNTGAVRLAGIE